jgi:hypothetical protein
MANSKKRPPQFPTLDELTDHFPDFFAALQDEPDVLVALLVGSYIDSMLYALLASHFASEDQAVDLLQVDGPLGNSFRRASVAYCIGMISGDELNLIRQICGIRNSFAHGWKERLTFESDAIAKKCAILEYRDEWIPTISTVLVRKPSGAPNYQSLRDRFIHVSWALLVGIILSRVLVRPARVNPYSPHGNGREGT